MKKRKLIYNTDFLLPRNNFIIGMGSVLNIAGSYFEYNYSKSSCEADTKALISDWENVGEDIKKAKSDFEIENQQQLCIK